jgi:hypothetical protein
MASSTTGGYIMKTTTTSTVTSFWRTLFEMLGQMGRWH